MLSERMGKWDFWLAVMGFNGTFFVQHFLGLMGMPRRVYTYPEPSRLGRPEPGLDGGRVYAWFGGAVIIVEDRPRACATERLPATIPGARWTLEWATSSPPPEHNFERVPPVRSRRPLWDLAHPEQPDPVLADETRADHPWLEKNLVGMSSFILSEAFFFVMLIAAFVYYNVQRHSGPLAAHTLDRWKTGLFSLFLFSSSFTIWRAEAALRHERLKRFYAWWGATILLGLVFICGQGREYAALFRKGVSINSSLFATTFFTLTGFHGLHVCLGLIALVIVLGLAWAGDFQRGRAEAVRNIGLVLAFRGCGVGVCFHGGLPDRTFLMTTNQFLASSWPLHWSSFAIAAAILAAFSIHRRADFSGAGRSFGFLSAALIVFLLTLDSPLEALADGYLFSAHMLQHLLLLLIVPALLLGAWGATEAKNAIFRMHRDDEPVSSLSPQPSPRSFLAGRGRQIVGRQLCLLPLLPGRRGLGSGGPLYPRFIESLFYHPLVTWLAGVGAMWFWHVPTLCDAATSNPGVRTVQTLSLLALGSLFWLPILGPNRERRLPALAGVLYLFTACVGCTLLGIIITFAPVSVCPVYLHPIDKLGLLPLIRTRWGITPALDQQIGGLLMWVPACLIYFCGILGLLARWYTTPPIRPSQSDPSAVEPTAA